MTPRTITMLVALALAGAAGAAERDWRNDYPRGGQVFSNVCYHEEAGDVLGDEIVLMPAGHRPAAYYRVAMGDFVDFRPASLHWRGDRLTLIVPADASESPVTFSGRRRPGRLEGAFTGGYTEGRTRLWIHNRRTPRPFC